MSSSDEFFKGLLFGAVIGTAAGLLLAPKSGAETREDIKKFSTDIQDKAQDLYLSSRKEVEKRIRALKVAGKKLDLDAYKQLVSKVVDELKNDSDVAASTAKKIGEQLTDDWNELKSAVV
ncbi:MAG: YtxH domain-containing protein [Candidatus Dojkabacteria bacterium]|jgi:gas vesicle protein|nr:YtxH domain-containing protein [Candidatus Dojkabacteria bacterium]